MKVIALHDSEKKVETIDNVEECAGGGIFEAAAVGLATYSAARRGGNSRLVSSVLGAGAGSQFM